MSATITKLKILIVEDEEYFRKHISKLLERYGQITEADNATAAIELIQKRYFDMVLIDINLHGVDEGFNVLEQAKAKGLFSVMLTDNEREEYIHRAYQIGVNHYLTKDQCEHVIDWIVKDRSSALGEEIAPDFFEVEYITKNQSLIQEIKSIKNRMMGDKSILILGETGVGKTKIAGYIHKMGGGKEQNFVSFNASSVPEALLESELFGHTKGAFASPDKNKQGLLQVANGGTLFLDEITSLPLGIQKKLLKCLDEKFFYPIGGIQPIKTNFRLVSSTCDNIYKLIQENQFRIDLFYRMNGIILSIPPLRLRKEDIPVLIHYFLKKCSRRIFIDKKAMEKLIVFGWPGNIRELKRVVEELSSKSNGMIIEQDLPKEILDNRENFCIVGKKKFITEEQVSFALKFGLKDFIEKIQLDIVREVLKSFSNNHRKSREALGLSKTTFYNLNLRSKEEDQKGKEMIQ
ncbi:MAG: sigma-54-dependent Fis family transcriptional regulator [Oligoflexia bacterium]|nr:sigma-54-dependent Fis family transcriptional regulator [Oligoflexia bacterium]